MAVVLISGGTGLIGTRLSQMLSEKGHSVIILTRKIKHTQKQYLQALWDPEKGTIDREVLQKADYIINLAGEGIAEKRWTEKRKKEIIESRVNSGRLIVKALREYPHQIKAVINASAIGWYGADKTGNPQTGFTEDAPPATGFLGTACTEWEKSIDPVADLGIRLCKIRVGLVMSTEGGALKEFVKPLRWGIATILGSGKQMQSWVHIDDVCRIFMYAIETSRLQGVYDAVAPRPVDHKSLILELAKNIKGSFYISAYVPSFVLKMMLGQLSEELLVSTTVSSEKIKSTGFQFVYPTIDAALKNLVQQK